MSRIPSDPALRARMQALTEAMQAEGRAMRGGDVVAGMRRMMALRDEMHALRAEIAAQDAATRQSARAGRGGRPQLDRASIAAAALAIADAEGLEAVSMRRVAQALGAGTMSLYHHVATKEALLGEMSDRIMSEVLLPAEAMTGLWRQDLRLIAHATRASFTAHPWVLTERPPGPSGPNAMAHFEQSLAALAAVDMPLADRLTLIATVDNYVFGHCLRAGMERGGPPAEEELDARAFAGIAEDGAHPEFARLIAREGAEAFFRQLTLSTRAEAIFEEGLGLILDGAARRFSLPD
ncbi:TetR/AcrR family transcriptional regulator [Pseudoroseicyclus sp. CXY001]|uniref:TetR/AcrR family transcriptional regulator n=1 Tax=Pseudoroseicyclus sp. CXY001 TaxID=3242492 RepID=UPI003570ACE3